MLDLGLEHLDVDIGDANHAEVDAVVQKCGQGRLRYLLESLSFSCFSLALAQLDSTTRSPREKAAVLVSAHKIVVGVSR